MNVFCLGSEQIDALWPLYGHHLERYEIETGEESAGELRRDLREARKQLWGFQEGDSVLGVMVTRIADTPRGLRCEICALCGTSERGLAIDVNDMLPHIETWAASEGCTRMRFLGRRGWKRMLNDYAETGVILEKEI